MVKYDPKTIEPKWRRYWAEQGIFRTGEQADKPKCYVLDMFPYPSGAGLHVGHPKGYIATDIYARYKLAQGFNVLHPMGWDAFGLPAENYAMQNKVHPKAAVDQNIARFKEQLQQIGFTYDWEREINTTDPDYYKWTQWIFLQLFQAGLAYEAEAPVNWCPQDQTVLANEDVENGRCERCGAVVEQRYWRQWVLKITKYADQLLAGLETLDWPESIKESQRNWIGRSEGWQIKFKIEKSPINSLEVYTTRADTIFGATYMVVAPEHPLVAGLLKSPAVKEYVEAAKRKNELTRTELEKDKTGVLLPGVTAINPATGEPVPVWVADYILGSYGAGAVMAVPAHDERDFAFAKKYGLPIKTVIAGGAVNQCWTGEGVLVDSGEFAGQPSAAAREAIGQWLQQKGLAKKQVNYKLRDWVFSRQRYWGEPIPIIHCEKCGSVPVPETDLPVELPAVDHYQPTGTGESPLAAMTEWVNTTCPVCAAPARRETNTMPQWAGSSWYYLRYVDPKNQQALIGKEKEKYWMPVDMYVGGAEHATRHLIYARFWHKFLFDQGYVSTPEPFCQLRHVGLILAEDGRKMSKRWGNVINPDDIVAQYGADTLRLYEMFMGPFSEAVAWSTAGIAGPRRWLERVWNLAQTAATSEEASVPLVLHQTIQRVTEDIEHFRFNTAIAAMMELVNKLEETGAVAQRTMRVVTQLLAPFAPHMGEELWQQLGGEGSVTQAAWPVTDEKILRAAQVTIAVQVNGRLRGTLTVAPRLTQAEIETQTRGLSNVQRYLKAKPKKVIFVADKLINFVV